MKTITIPSREYLQMQQTVDQLQQQLQWLQDQLKSHLIYQRVSQPLTIPPSHSKPPVSIKRGSATAIITYFAEDFTAPLPDFQDYMSL